MNIEGCIVGCQDGVRVGAGDIDGAGDGWALGVPEGFIDAEGLAVGKKVGEVVGLGVGGGVGIELFVAPMVRGATVAPGMMVSSVLGGTVTVMVSFCACARTTKASRLAAMRKNIARCGYNNAPDRESVEKRVRLFLLPDFPFCASKPPYPVATVIATPGGGISTGPE